MLPDIKSTKNPTAKPRSRSSALGKFSLKTKNGKKKMKGENNGDTLILFSNKT
jgi:hypothetical protein